MERLQIQLDETAVHANLATVRRLASPTTTIMGVVKANAYGHGLETASRLLIRHGVQELAVATIDEGCRLREAGIHVPVTLLAPVTAASAREVAARRLRPSLSCLAAARDLHRAARAGRRPLPVHIEIDTGLGRYGWPAMRTALAPLEQLAALDGLVVASVYTHLGGACRAALADQLRLFDHAYAQVAAVLGHRPRRHALASSAMSAGLCHPTATQLVRPGALLYGLAPCYGDIPSPRGLRPVLSATSHIAHLTELPAGASIGYGAARRLPEPARIAVVPAGFADGIPRQLADRGRVLIRGRYAPIVATVGMTHLTIDVTDIPHASTGDTVTLIGAQGAAAIDVSEWARLTGTITSDVLTRLAPALPRAVTLMPNAQGALSA
ncbi:alanine racemase [Nonomuraea sp. NPDC023979]|uniref:alanine racemase n=1 Tax=Nonomuraea sp. NPDC023979 TaxID=3154796 RepID=UPI003405D5CC